MADENASNAPDTADAIIAEMNRVVSPQQEESSSRTLKTLTFGPGEARPKSYAEALAANARREREAGAKQQTQQQQPEAKEQDDSPEGEETEGLEFEKQEDEDARETVAAQDGHKLEVSEEVPSEMREQITEQIGEVGAIAKSLGVSQEVTQDLVDYAISLASMDQSHFDPTALNAQEVGQATLEQRYGQTIAKQIVSDARDAVTRLGPKVAAFLDRTGYGNSPAVLFALAQYKNGNFHLSPEAAQRSLDQVLKGEGKGAELRKAISNSAHPKHAYAKDAMALLYQRAARKGGTVDAPQKQVATQADRVTTAQAKLDAEIKTARSDPAYTKWDHPDHKAAVARVDALYRARYPDE